MQATQPQSEKFLITYGRPCMKRLAIVAKKRTLRHIGLKKPPMSVRTASVVPLLGQNKIALFAAEITQ
jgi:hypothetical protein